MFDFGDQVALITGGAGNLGAAAARAFYHVGARVAVLDRHRQTTTQVLGQDVPEGEHCAYVTGNLLDEVSVAEMVTEVFNRFGRIDILLNTAGGYRAGTPLHTTPNETWDLMMNLNARSVFLMSRAVVPHMLAAGRGKIVNVAARAALQGTADAGPYVASKMAVIRLTETLAAELADHGINVNCILPGSMDTPDNRAAQPEADFSRWVTPESMAQVILFLASDLAKDINGAAVPIYGRG